MSTGMRFQGLLSSGIGGPALIRNAINSPPRSSVDDPPRVRHWKAGGWAAALLYKFLYNSPVARLKPVEFLGRSLEGLKSFPVDARRDAGFQLDLVQRGMDPVDWKPMPDIGRGVREIRIRDASGAFRVVYVATFAEAVYVLHCFEKKSRRTAKSDIELASVRYRELSARRMS